MNRPEVFDAWLARLESVCGNGIASFPALLEALRQRRDFFHERGWTIQLHLGALRINNTRVTEAILSAARFTRLGV